MIDRAILHQTLDAFVDRIERNDGEPWEITITEGSDVLVKESTASGWVTRRRNGTATLLITINGGAIDVEDGG